MILFNVSLFLILSVVFVSDAYKFLIVCPYAVKSLNILGEGYVKLLTNAGHEVIYISPFPLKIAPKKNYRHIDVSQNIGVLSECRTEKVKSGWFGTQSTENSTLSVNFIMKNEINMNDIQYFQETALKTAISTLEDAEVKELLDSDEKFDAVIVDWFQTDIYAGLSALFKCPLIWSYSIGVDWNILQLVDEPTNPAFANDYLSSNIPPYTFKQRVQELWVRIKSYFIKRFIITPKDKSVYEKIFGPLFEKRNRTLSNYEEVTYNASMLLINDHQAIGGVPATSQNVKLVGGFHISTSENSLSKPLKSIMDNAKDGVIYFSMGSTWQSKDIPKEITEKLLKLFGELMQTVIWKYEDDLTNVPCNVHIVKWAPQQSILAHPNCLLFITHGGILSLIEAIHFGVPTIGIPIYLDQFKNVNKAVANGNALKVNLTMNLPEDLKNAIEEILNNTKYRERVKELSLIYHDRPLRPSAEVVHWIEHVVRTRGATHLRSPALMVPWYQKMYLDLIFIILIIFTIIYIIMKKVFLQTIKNQAINKIINNEKKD